MVSRIGYGLTLERPKYLSSEPDPDNSRSEILKVSTLLETGDPALSNLAEQIASEIALVSQLPMSYKWVTATFTRPNNTEEYASGSIITNDTAHIKLENIVSEDGGFGRLLFMSIDIMSANATSPLIAFFTDEPTLSFVDGTVYDLNPVDAANFLGMVDSFTTRGEAAHNLYYTTPATRYLPEYFLCEPDSRDLWMILYISGPWTPDASTEYRIRVLVEST